jgi:PAS domain S-box-containing protein
VPIVLALMLGTVLTVQTYHLQKAMKEVEHSYQVQTRSRTMLKLLLDLETSVRGFLLTGDDGFLQPYRQAGPQISTSLDELRKLTSNDSTQNALVSQISDQYAQLQKYSEQMVQQKRSGLAVNDVASNLAEKQMMDRIRAARDQMLQIEEQRLEQRVMHVRKSLSETFWTVLGLSLFMGLVVATFSRQELAWAARSFDKTLATADSRAEELHQSQIWLGAVLRSIGDGVLATDEEGLIVFSNEQARRLLGKTAEEVGQSHTSEALRLVDEYSREELADPFEQVMKKLTLVRKPGSHTLLLQPSGNEIPIDISAFPIRDVNDGVTGAVIVLRDLTEQRQSERTLQSTEKMATMGRIAATVAHEIHNPLDAMGNLLYLLENTSSLDATAKNYVCLAREELERVANISEQMLTFSREARQPTDVRVADSIENVLTLFAARIRRANVRVVKELDPNLYIKAFPGEIRQVLSNLIGNALDAMSSSGVLKIRAEAARDWKNGDQGVRVMVSDNGAGVPKEVRSHLMEAFVTSKGEKGTGLGLWVCRGIVEKYHGSLRYKTSTKPGRSGTTFSVFMPVEAAKIIEHSRVARRERVG